MSNKIETKKPKTKQKLSKSALVLTVGLIIILIPCLVFAGILLSASLKTGTPIVGTRFENDLDPAINDGDIKYIQTTVEQMGDVEKVEITLKTAQLRINVDVKDSLSDDDVSAVVDAIYEVVNAKIPVNTYFTATASKKMYDLSINVYNHIGNEDGSMVYYILTKNSNMSSPDVQLVSKPLDEGLAKELRGETVEDNQEGVTE